MPKNAKKCQNTFVCQCGNTYKFRQGLYKHKQKCLVLQDDANQQNIITNIQTTNIQTTNTQTTNIEKHDITHKLVELIMSKNQEFITEIVCNMKQSNKDIMEKMMEIIPNIGSGNNNNNSFNTQNFNIQMFLNEHCKNAMNLTDFINSLPITSETYDSTIENGLTKTITNMLVNGLSQLDILDRPIHCTDATRKILYVKDDNIWEKDTELIRMFLGIKTLARKQRMMINKWQDVNEGWETDDYIQTKLTTLVSHSMMNIESDEKEMNKIFRAIGKQTYLSNEIKKEYK